MHAPAISDLEASLHDRFATRRVLGEWFELPGRAALAEAVDAARILAAVQDEHLNALREAEDLKSIESNTELVAATADVVDWHRKTIAARALKSGVAKLRKQSEAVFKLALAAGADIGLFATVTERNRESFDNDKFAESNPDLFQQFLRAETKLTQRFDPKKIEADVFTQPDDEFTGLATRMEVLVQSATSNFDLLEDLHLAHLELLSHQARSAWDLELAEANLKVACGSAPGIEGLCTWPRVLSTTEKFDPAAFMRAHPDLHEEFCRVVVVPSFAVRPMRSYRPQLS